MRVLGIMFTIITVILYIRMSAFHQLIVNFLAKTFVSRFPLNHLFMQHYHRKTQSSFRNGDIIRTETLPANINCATQTKVNRRCTLYYVLHHLVIYDRIISTILSNYKILLMTMTRSFSLMTLTTKTEITMLVIYICQANQKRKHLRIVQHFHHFREPTYRTQGESL